MLTSWQKCHVFNLISIFNDFFLNKEKTAQTISEDNRHVHA